MNDKRIKTKFVFVGILGFLMLQSCKKNQNSEVSATTKMSGAQLDLTSYDDATTKEYENMKKEVDAKWKAYPYSHFEDISKEKHLDTVYKTIPTKKPLSWEETVAMVIYTRSPYVQINDDLRNKASQTLPQLDDTIKTIASGINKLKTKPCITYRGIWNTPAAKTFLDQAVKAKKMTELAFMSSTPVLSEAKSYAMKGGNILRIRSSQCRDITWLRKGESNTKEVVFPPGSEFLVIRYSAKKWAFGYNNIDLIHLVPGTPQYNAASTKRLISITSVLGRFGLYPPKAKGVTALTDLSNIDTLANSGTDDDWDNETLKAIGTDPTPEEMQMLEGEL
ncbi:MAG: hypothetical protein H7249_11595 [Chitinophagaceae bacterium]|nr:hypothetical protein [Oligoflexus sp.]